jgi:glc operon protein GlcG
MTKLRLGVAVLATVSCLSAVAHTINVTTLDQAGAQMVLQAAKASAQQRHAPSAIAVVDPAGDLLAFERMDSVRPASADLAIGKARTAARLQRPTAEIEDNVAAAWLTEYWHAAPNAVGVFGIPRTWAL